MEWKDGWHIQMLQFNKVVLHNFGSYCHTEVDLKDRGFCLVTGENNYKDDNAKSNGAGKSFLWSAICFALTGETINGLHSNLRNINADPEDKKCYVSLEFISNNDQFKITRIIEPKSDLSIIKNNTDISGKGIKASEEILKAALPDVTKNLIASTIIIGQGMPNKFSSFSPSGRKELLEKLTNSDFMIDDLKKRVSNRLLELATALRTYEDKLLVTNTQIANKTNTLQITKANLTTAEQRTSIETEIKEAEVKIASITLDLTNVNNELTVEEQNLEALNNTLISSTNEKLMAGADEEKKYNETIYNLNTRKMELNTKINSTTNELNRLKSIKDVCPTCGQKLVGVVKPDTTAQETLLVELNKQLAELQVEIQTATMEHQNYTRELNNKYDANINNIKLNINNCKYNINNYKNSSNDFNHYLAIETEQLNKLQYEKANHLETIVNLKKLISDTEAEINELNKTIASVDLEKTKIIERQAIVKKMDTLLKREFRGYLLANIINYIDNKAKDLCEIVFGTRNLNVFIDGNALNITYCDKVFDNLSGGEKQRVDLILQFAIRSMLNYYLNTSANILVLDEITDFLDSQSCEAVMNLVEQELGTIESVFIISHHADELRLPIDSRLKIIKHENGISEVF